MFNTPTASIPDNEDVCMYKWKKMIKILSLKRRFDAGKCHQSVHVVNFFEKTQLLTTWKLFLHRFAVVTWKPNALKILYIKNNLSEVIWKNILQPF